MSYGLVYYGSRRAEQCKSFRRNVFTYKSPSPSLKITILTTTHFKKEFQIFVLVLLHCTALLNEACRKNCKTFFFFYNFSLFILPVLYGPLVHVYMSEYYNQKQCHAEEYSNEYPQLSGIFKL